MPLSSPHSNNLSAIANFRVFAAIICVTATMTAVTCCQLAAQDSAPAPAQKKSPEVELDTTAGKIIIALDAEKAPKTVANFLDYVKSGHYNGTIFHRVIPDFMCQAKLCQTASNPVCRVNRVAEMETFLLSGLALFGFYYDMEGR